MQVQTLPELISLARAGWRFGRYVNLTDVRGVLAYLTKPFSAKSLMSRYIG
jgi:hypothetical protein